MDASILGNKYLYKIFIFVSKYIPYVLVLTQILGTTLLYFNISCVWISVLGGCSVSVVFLILLVSHVFKFCKIHRIPLYYIMLIYGLYAYKFRNNPKIDHIKQLCERYNCNCK